MQSNIYNICLILILTVTLSACKTRYVLIQTDFPEPPAELMADPVKLKTLPLPTAKPETISDELL